MGQGTAVAHSWPRWALPFGVSSKARRATLKAVAKDGSALKGASRRLRADPEVVLAAVRQSGCAFKYACRALREDKAFVLAAVAEDGLAIRHADKALQEDQDVILAAVHENFCVLKHVNPELLEERDFFYAAVKANYRALDFANDRFREDPEVVLAAIKANYTVFQRVSPTLQENRDFVLSAVAVEGWALEFASASLRADREIVLTAMANRYDVLQYAGEQLRDSITYEVERSGSSEREFARLVCERRDRLRADPSDAATALNAISLLAEAYTMSSEGLRNDRHFNLSAVASNAEVLPLLSQEFVWDDDFLLEAIVRNPLVLSQADWKRLDRGFLLRVLQRNGDVAQFLDAGLREEFQTTQTLDLFAEVSHLPKGTPLILASAPDELLPEAVRIIESHGGLYAGGGEDEEEFDEGQRCTDREWGQRWTDRVRLVIQVFSKLFGKCVAVALQGGPVCDWERNELIYTLKQAHAGVELAFVANLTELEALASQLSPQVEGTPLGEEIARLRRENEWLKGLREECLREEGECLPEKPPGGELTPEG